MNFSARISCLPQATCLAPRTGSRGLQGHKHRPQQPVHHTVVLRCVGALDTGRCHMKDVCCGNCYAVACSVEQYLPPSGCDSQACHHITEVEEVLRGQNFAIASHNIGREGYRASVDQLEIIKSVGLNDGIDRVLHFRQFCLAPHVLYVLHSHFDDKDVVWVGEDHNHVRFVVAVGRVIEYFFPSLDGNLPLAALECFVAVGSTKLQPPGTALGRPEAVEQGLRRQRLEV
ncbi:hypothetical protein HUJ05_007881 [Dendroctonus ponderosae]|nr:hypothetical protein HUJ05_007881 [Dendroctonus ponderosae]